MMKRNLLKSKIHRATVTGADLNYEGSISISPSLCKAAQLIPYEKVDIYNINNGNRFSTYIILGQERQVVLNGAAARLVYPGDTIIIASYGDFDEEECKSFTPIKVMVNSSNEVVEIT